MSHDLSRVGDHFFLGLRKSPVLDDTDRRLLATIRPAGVIFFKPNFRHDLPYESWLEHHTALVAEIRGLVGRERMLIAVDHEGGRVVRTPPPITRFAYAEHWAERGAEVARAMARELASLGFNMTFAPCLDIHSNPANPVIGPRAFGTTADAVIRHAIPFLGALHAEGVLGCGKHYPGHGDTAQDSHDELPVVDSSLEHLRARELRPFAAAVQAGVPLMMTSHILFPQVDPDLPATLSPRFVTDILRGELGYTGAVTTDDIGMGAMASYFGENEAAVRCLAAGSDMIMVCAHFTDTGRALGFASAVAAAEAEGRLDLTASRARVAALLARAHNHPVRPLSPEVFAAHARVAPLFGADIASVAI